MPETTTELPEDKFNDEAFWAKIKRFSLQAGCEVVRYALILYYAMLDKDTPLWAKGVILGALAYFVLPTDAIPDFIPGAGYSDDLGALAAAFGLVIAHIKEEHKRRARQQLKTLFGPDACPEPDGPIGAAKA